MRERDAAIAAGLDALARPKASRMETLDAAGPLRGLPYNGSMSVQHFVDEQGRYDGKTRKSCGRWWSTRLSEPSTRPR